MNQIYHPSGPISEVLLSSSSRYEGYTIVERSTNLSLIKELLGTTLADLNLELTLVNPDKLRKIAGRFLTEIQAAANQAEINLPTSALWEVLTAAGCDH